MTTSAGHMVRIFGFEVPTPAGSREDKQKEIIGEVAAATETCLFNEEELSGIMVTQRGSDFVEVGCGCTNKRFGDFDGKLKIYGDGKLEITCLCHPACALVNVSPREFETHAKMKAAGRWKSNIWVCPTTNEAKRRSLVKTNLLKYFERLGSRSNRKRRGFVHKDEFIECYKCHKSRRFKRRDERQCLLYHQAYLVRDKWACRDHPYYWMGCDRRQERKTRKDGRRCPKNNGKCEGCMHCECFGCRMCRFEDCSCRDCLDYIVNNAPGSSSNNNS